MDKVNLILVGMTGTGKSACGNTILGRQAFKSKASSLPVTKECEKAENGCLRVIDTPDIFDDSTHPSVIAEHVQMSKRLCHSGPSVFLLVLQVSRFTEGERDIMEKLERAFGSKVAERTVILFTHGDNLYRAGMDLESFRNSCQFHLQKIVKKCGYRCVVFDNKSGDQEQVANLMREVEQVVKEKKQQTTFLSRSGDDRYLCGVKV